MIDLKNMSEEERAARRARAYENKIEVARVAAQPEKTMKPLVLPQINLNGSPKERLVEQQCDVMHAAEALLKALQEATPNGRDYVFRPAELQPALEAWSQRWVMIDDLRKEIEAHAIAIQES